MIGDQVQVFNFVGFTFKSRETLFSENALKLLDILDELFGEKVSESTDLVWYCPIKRISVKDLLIYVKKSFSCNEFQLKNLLKEVTSPISIEYKLKKLGSKNFVAVTNGSLFRVSFINNTDNTKVELVEFRMTLDFSKVSGDIKIKNRLVAILQEMKMNKWVPLMRLQI